jgi:PIN domain nuclease of toxin-antitoxin system
LSEVVLDASAVLALLNQEPGHEKVESALEGAVIGTVNLSEVMAKLVERGMPEPQAVSAIQELDLEIVPFDTQLAFQAGALRALTKPLGLSLGDRACVALGQHLTLPVLTAERKWQALSALSSEIQIQLIR